MAGPNPTIFLDTNVFLSFYGLSSDDLEELRKLAVLLRQKHATMILPQQTEEEFTRNRPSKIADAMKRFRDQKLTLLIPQLAREYAVFQEVTRLQRELERAHALLIDNVLRDIDNSTLKADVVIAELLALSTRVPTTAALLQRARTRHELRNPPGKQDSIGDALNWESLLDHVPKKTTLIFVTDDADYQSPLKERAFHPFLLQEWSRVKNSELVYFRRLSDFFAARYPQITLARDAEKDLLIRELATSGSFSKTHSVINHLSQYVDFSIGQRNDLLRAATANTQVSWIIGDDDVREFLLSVIRGHEPHLDKTLLADFNRILQQYLDDERARQARDQVSQSKTDDDLPF